jgi:hypothetical protein
MNAPTPQSDFEDESGYRLLEPHEPHPGGLPPDFTSRLQAALHARRRGFAVFPLLGTTPAIPDWQSVATTDEAVIRQWWTENPDYNIGAVIESLVVLHIDQRRGGFDQLDMLKTIYGLPNTAVAAPPKNEGLAFFGLPPGVRIKSGAQLDGAPGIDVISGGHIALPGSTIDGIPYHRWSNWRPVAPAPQWLIDRLAEPVETVQPTQTEGNMEMGAGVEAVEAYRKGQLAGVPAPSIAAEHLEETDTSSPAAADDYDKEKDTSRIGRSALSAEPEGATTGPPTRYSLAFDWIISEESPEATPTTQHDTMLQIATRLRGEFGVSESEAISLLSTWWFMECEPSPRRQGEIAQIVKRAFSADQQNSTYSPPPLHQSPISPKATTNLDTGLALAKLGFNIFPVESNGKKPLISGWQIAATANETKIIEWSKQFPGCNWAIPTGHLNDGLTVIDVDPRNGGNETMKRLRAAEEFPPTLSVKTQSGGTHFYYRSDIPLKSRADALGPGVDVKSRGGYVVAPGSTIDGRCYDWLPGNKQIAKLPTWLVGRCSAAMPKSAAAGKRLVDETPAAVREATAWIRDHAPEAHEGNHGDDTTFRVAARLFDIGVWKETALDLMLEWNEEKAFPPWELADIERIVDSAGRNRREPIGISTTASGFEPVEIPEREHLGRIDGHKAEKLPSGDKPRGLYYLTFAEATALAFTAGAEPLIEDVLDVETFSIVYGESSIGKSFQEMDKDFCIAAGLPWAGKPVKQGGVVWVAAEGGRGVYKRLEALKQHYKRDDVPFFIVPCPVDLLRPNADTKPLIEMIQGIERDKGVKVVKATVDTLSRALAGGNENGPEDMGALIKNCDKLRFACRLHLTLIHHTGLADKSRARGSSLLRAAADTEIEITRGRIRVTKQRDMEQTGEWGFRLSSMNLGPDEKGRPVSSPWVEILPKGSPLAEPLDLEPELQMLADEIEANLTEKGTFSTKMAIDCALTAAFFDRDPSRASESADPAERERVNRALKTMHEKGWIAKLRRGQWKWRGYTDARDA